jgi:alpha,alpha-trehalase
VCADLATVDLNALLYKYETDLADTISTVFNDRLEMADGFVTTSQAWTERAHRRRQLVNRFLWNEEDGMYYDYNTRTNQPSVYQSVTALWTMWANLPTPDQAARLTKKCLQLFEVSGGLVSGTRTSRGEISLERPSRQWDYPYGWAPHQILAWQALVNYGYVQDAQRCAYRWLHTITRAFVDFNGVVPEKFDVVDATHLIHVEYGQVGIDFKYIPKEGFGWMNASYQVGLALLSERERRALSALVEPNSLYKD